MYNGRDFIGWYCYKCESLCHPYEQGLCCNCDQPWNTERYTEKDYPDEWKRVSVKIIPMDGE